MHSLRVLYFLILWQVVALNSVNANTLLEDTIVDDPVYSLAGTFGAYDFADSESAFDWAFTTNSGVSYQLQGNPPSENDVFGWKQVSIPTPDPLWYMFQLHGDVDADGTTKFDWLLASTNMGKKALYKLEGETESGNFKYSAKLNLDYSLNGTQMTISTDETTSEVDNKSLLIEIDDNTSSTYALLSHTASNETLSIYVKKDQAGAPTAVKGALFTTSDENGSILIDFGEEANAEVLFFDEKYKLILTNYNENNVTAVVYDLSDNYVGGPYTLTLSHAYGAPQIRGITDYFGDVGNVAKELGCAVVEYVPITYIKNGGSLLCAADGVIETATNIDQALNSEETQKIEWGEEELDNCLLGAAEQMIGVDVPLIGDVKDCIQPTVDVAEAAQSLTSYTADYMGPSTPPNASAVAFSPTEIVITWEASSDSSGIFNYNISSSDESVYGFHNVYASEAVNGAYSTIFSGLTPETHYCFDITAYDMSANFNKSLLPALACATTPVIEVTELSAPQLIAPICGNDLIVPFEESTSFNLMWSAVEGADNYRYESQYIFGDAWSTYEKYDVDGTSVTKGWAGRTQIYEKDFRWRVLAMKDGIEGPVSSWCSHVVKTPDINLKPPKIVGPACGTTLTADANSTGSVSVNWERVIEVVNPNTGIYEERVVNDPNIGSHIETEVIYDDGYVYRETYGISSSKNTATISWSNTKYRDMIGIRWRVRGNISKTGDDIIGPWSAWCSYSSSLK